MKAKARSLAVSRIARPRSGRAVFGAACVCVLGLAAFLGSGAPTAGADTACSNEAVRLEQESTYLPDCRAYEQVSPAAKNGFDVLAYSARSRAAASGEAMQFASLNGFGADQSGSDFASEFLATRSAAGWSTHGVTPPNTPISLAESVAASWETRYLGALTPDLDTGVFLTNTQLNAEGPDVANVPKLYRVTGLLSSLGSPKLTTDCPVCAAPLPYTLTSQPSFAGANAGTSSVAAYTHVLFQYAANLLAGTSGTLPKAYAWHDGTLALVGMVPASGTSCSGAACVPAASSAPGRGGLGLQNNRGSFPGENAISADGRYAFFTSPVNAQGEATAASQLFLRDTQGTADLADDATVQVSATERAAPDATQPATFQGASADGSVAFFTSKAALTEAAPVSSAAKLYRYSLAPDGSGHHLTLLATTLGVGVSGVLGVSGDGSYVYFLADQQLDPAAANACSGPEPCIFVWHQPAADAPTIHEVGQVLNGETINLGQTAINGFPTSRLTPSGRYLTFMSEASTLPGDNGTACPGNRDLTQANIAEGCMEVYVYDASADAGQGHLVCASCGPAPAAADASFNVKSTTGAAKPGTYLNRPLSDDGRYVFFSTGDALVPQDSNGRVDVYEYDLRYDQLYLISSGIASSDSFFLDASADGSDVFFTTRQRLLGSDTDEAVDVYDARVDGGFPEPLVPTPPCAGEACQASPANAAAPQGLPLSALSGPPNPHPARVATKKHKAKPKKKHRRHKAKPQQRKRHSRTHQADRHRRATR